MIMISTKHSTFHMGSFITPEALEGDKNLLEFFGNVKPERVYIGKYPKQAIDLDLPEGDKSYICALIDGKWQDMWD